MSEDGQQEPAPERSAPGSWGRLSAWLADARGERRLVGLVVLLALVLRLIYVNDMRANPAFELPSMDALYHVEWARAIVSGADFLRERHHPVGEASPLFRAPGYILFLSGLFELFGNGLLIPRLFQCALGGLTTLLVYLLGKRAFSREVGLLAALMAAGYWVLIYFDGELLIPSLYVPITLLGLWLALGLAPSEAERSGELPARAPQWRGPLSTGLVFGLAAIVRPNVLLVMPVIALWVLWCRRPSSTGASWRAALLPSAALTLGTLLPIAPVTAYNTLVGHDFSLIATQGGVNFWIGNNPESDGSTAVVPGTRAGWWTGYQDSVAQAQAAVGHDLSPSEVSDYYAGLAWEFMRSQPGNALALMGRKLMLLWNRWEMGNNQPVRFYAFHFSALMRYLPLGYGLLAPLALFGFCLSIRSRRLVPLTGFLAVYALSILLFFVCSRFRVPLLPPMMIFAARALEWGWARARLRRFGGVALLLGVTGLGAALSYTPLEGTEHADSTGYWSLGLAEGIRGNEPLAIDYLHRAIELYPGNYYARLTLAKVLDHKQRPEEALVQLREVLRTRPDSVDGIELYLQILGRTGHFEELESSALAIIAAQPTLSLPHLILGTVRSNQGRKQDAIQLYQRAHELDQEAFTPLLALGSVSAEVGRRELAVNSLEAALKNVRRAGPGELEMTYEKLVALWLPSDPARARHFAREFLTLAPKSPRAQKLMREVDEH